MMAPAPIIARPVEWPERTTHPERSGLKLRWDAIGPDGEALVLCTTHPLYDGAHALLARGADPESLVTLRHEGAAQDSFRPMRLCIPASAGAKRADGRARLAARREAA